MRAAVPLIWLLLAALLTGCEAVSEGTTHVGRERLLDDMSRQLQRGDQVRYQAEYQLAGGLRATVAQQLSPNKTAYGYPGGLLIVEEDERTNCDVSAARPKCELRAKGGDGQAEAFAAVTKKGLVAAPVVAELLRVAIGQPSTTVKGHDTTVAGLPASCLEILNLADSRSVGFNACVTADGVLASFAGVIDGVNIDQALEQLSLRAPDPMLFAVPANADVVDLRQT